MRFQVSMCEMLLRSGQHEVCRREFDDFAVGIEITISDPCRSDSHVGDSLPVLMGHALGVDGEVHGLQSLKLRTGRLISDPLVLHGDFLVPSHDNADIRTLAQVLAFSRSAKSIEYYLEPISHGDSDQRRLWVTSLRGRRDNAEPVLLKKSEEQFGCHGIQALPSLARRSGVRQMQRSRLAPVNVIESVLQSELRRQQHLPASAYRGGVVRECVDGAADELRTF